MIAVERLRLRTQSLLGPVACVDLETTGGLAAHHRIIEVGIVLLDRGEVVEQWSTLVNPGLRIPSAIAEFTGIDDSMVAEAPPFDEVAATLDRDPAACRFSGSWRSAQPARITAAITSGNAV